MCDILFSIDVWTRFEGLEFNVGGFFVPVFCVFCFFASAMRAAVKKLMLSYWWLATETATAASANVDFFADSAYSFFFFEGWCVEVESRQ